MGLRPGFRGAEYKKEQIVLAQQIAIQKLLTNSPDKIYAFISSAEQLDTVALVEVLNHCTEPLSLTSCLNAIVKRDDYDSYIDRTQGPSLDFKKLKTLGWEISRRWETFLQDVKHMD